MSEFKLVSDFKPTGDQPQAIEKLTQGVKRGLQHQVLLGVTGSGKTYTVAKVIEKIQKPTLIISHNKTLAAQLYQEFRDFFPDNSVNYFVSYYDYYQPEAYIPQTDTYIEKETEINEEIDKLRLAATTALSTRNDVIVVASVSCIYNIGSPVEYGRFIVEMAKGQKWDRYDLLREFTKLHYVRNDLQLLRGTFRVRGENIEIYPAYEDLGLRLEFSGERLEKLTKIDPIAGKKITEIGQIVLYPAKHYVTSEGVMKAGINQILVDLEKGEKEINKQNKALFAHRLHQRTIYDIEQMREFGYCKGIENYSRYFDGRKPGEPPYTLLNYFPKDFLLVIDESHMTVPQIRAMYNQDKVRKETLIGFGFRLPSALDNRPLKFEEFLKRVNQVIYTSATPDEWELNLASNKARNLKLKIERGKFEHTGIVEQLIRPTGLVDPEIEIRSTEGQIDNLIAEIQKRASKNQRILVTTLTKRMAEDLANYLADYGIKVHYLHSEIETLDRADILDDLRLGKFDVVVGINLLREGLDLPEVSLVAILDADKEGFLRSRTSLIQVMGRAARHKEGKVIMYADNLTDSMKKAIDEVERRKAVQIEYNKKHGVTPKGIIKPVRKKLVEREEKPDYRKILTEDNVIAEAIRRAQEGSLLVDDRERLIKILQREMRDAARNLEFEKAAVLRDQIFTLRTH